MSGSPPALRRGVVWVALALLPVLSASGASRPAAAPESAAARLSRPGALPSPAGAGSRFPNLAILADGRVIMSWFEPRADSSMALRCAVFDGRRWTAPATIAAGDSFFVNWADFPSVRPLGGKRLAAHWPWKSGAGTYAYDVRISLSEDEGRSWGPVVIPHRDGTATEHGFVSLLPHAQGVRAIWLDGRKGAGHEHDDEGPGPDMTLRTAVVTPDARLIEEAEIDGRVCDCCQTATVATDRGVLVAYRDRSADEVRDISFAREDRNAWTAPRPVHADGWVIPGCPVNGPALEARGPYVAIAWYTAALDSPRVLAAFSDDGGSSFGPPIGLDDGDPLGRVHLVLLEDGSAVITWLEAGQGAAQLRARRVWRGGRRSEAITVASTAASRASGFPRVARSGKALYFAWTEVGKPPRVIVARSTLR